jgi:hypothetical protein
MDTIAQVFSDAMPIWERVILQLSWYHGLIAAAYLGAAWLCLLNGHIAKNSQEAHITWNVAAAALCVLAANSVLRGDVFVTHALRSLAKLEGWYGERRVAQYLAVLVLALIVLSVAGWLRRAFTASNVASESVALGLAVLLVLLLVRTVSAHGTDAIINLRLAGVSVGRLLEFAGIGLVLHGAMRCLRLR